MTPGSRVGTTLVAMAAVLAMLAGEPAFAKGSHSGGTTHSTGHSASQSQSTGHAAGSKGQPATHAHGARHGGNDGPASPHSSGNKTAAGVKRDSDGKIARSSEQKTAFKHSHPCPATGKSSGSCPGYVIDHRVPLKRGGADKPENMQWQTTAASKAKDKTE